MMINTMDDGKMNRFEIEQLHEIIIAILEIFFGAKIWGSGQRLLDPYGTFKHFISWKTQLLEFNPVILGIDGPSKIPKMRFTHC